MTAANKRTHLRESRWFESMYTLQGETRLTRHTYSTLSPCMVPDHTYLTRSTHSDLSCVNRFVQIHCPWEEGLLTQSTTQRPSNLRVCTQLLSHNNQWGSGEKASFCWQPATRLTGPISPACDHYVQYFLTGVNSSVPNRHRWGLQP
jgi:hypothetical protein